MGLWKDFTGIVKNVVGIKAGKGVYIALTNDYSHVTPVIDNGIDYDGAYNSGTLGVNYSDNIESGTLRGDLSADFSYGINAIRTMAHVNSINSGLTNFATQMLHPYEELGELGNHTEWTVPTRFDLRTHMPLLSGVIATDGSHDALESGKTYMYLGSNIHIPVYPYKITDVTTLIQKGDLVFCIAAVAANASIINSVIPLSKHLTTTFTTASDLGTNTPDSSVIINPGISGVDGYTLTPNAVYANDRGFLTHGRSSIKWTRKTPEPSTGGVGLSSGVLVVDMSGDIGKKTSVSIPDGCCITGVSVDISSVFTGSWSLSADINSTLIEIINSSEVANIANTQTQKDDLFYVSTMASYETFLNITSSSNVSLLVYVKYEPLYTAV